LGASAEAHLSLQRLRLTKADSGVAANAAAPFFSPNPSQPV